MASGHPARRRKALRPPDLVERDRLEMGTRTRVPAFRAEDTAANPGAWPAVR